MVVDDRSAGVVIAFVAMMVAISVMVDDELFGVASV